MRLLRRRRAPDDRGAVLAVIALSMAALLTMSAIAVDLGRQMLRRREAQAVADVVAIDLVRLLDGRTEADIEADPTWASTRSAGATRNNFPTTNVTAELGFYNAIADVFTPTASTQIPDSVRVTATDSVEFFFGRVVGLNSGAVNRTAVASRSAIAGFSLGSFGAAITPQTGGLLNSLLNDALNISLISYQGLANANVTLGQVALMLEFTTPQDLLTSSVGFDDFFLATANVLRLNGDTANATLLEQAVLTSNVNGNFDIADVVGVTTPGEQSALDATTNVLDLLSAAAFVANGSSGLGLPTIALNVGGLLNLNGSAVIVQQPTTVFGPVGTQARNSQIDVVLTGSVNVPLLAAIDVRVELSIASALGTISRIGCSTPEELDVSVLSGLVEFDVIVGVDTLLLPRIPLTASTEFLPAPDTAAFDLPPNVPGDRDETGTGTIGLTGVTFGGGGLLGPLLGTVTSQVLTPLLAALDTQLLGPVTDLLGVNVGGADVFLRAVDCEPPDLVR